MKSTLLALRATVVAGGFAYLWFWLARWVRSPMYEGALAILLGAGLVLRSPAIALLALGFILLAHAFVVLYEEPALERAFGGGYREYRRSVGRRLPRWPWSGRA